MLSDIHDHDNPPLPTLDATEPLVIDLCTFCGGWCPKTEVEQITGVEWRENDTGIKRCDTFLPIGYRLVGFLCLTFSAGCAVLLFATILQVMWWVSGLLIAGTVAGYKADKAIEMRIKRRDGGKSWDCET